MQISSDDYVYQDGEKVQSSRLPGYSGAHGLNDDRHNDRMTGKGSDAQGKGNDNGRQGNNHQGRDLEAVSIHTSPFLPWTLPP